MRAAFVFLSVFLPLGALLWWSMLGTPPMPAPPRALEELPTEALIGPRDLAGAQAAAMIHGEVLRATELELKLVDEGHVQLYATVDGLDRVDDEPRLRKVRLALFDPPKDGRENLRVVLEAPWLATDLAPWLGRDGNERRTVHLSGGVIALDARGLELARIENLDVDVGRREVRSSSRFVVRDPESGLELHADGLLGRLDLRELELLGEITAVVPAGDARARLVGAGPATVREVTDPGDPEAPGRIELSLPNGVVLEHPMVRATAPRLEVSARRDGSRLALLGARLGSPVRLQFQADRAAGLERIEAQALVLREEGRWALEGPVTGTARGPLPLLRAEARELGEQGYGFSAGMAEVELGPDAPGDRGPMAGARLVRFDGGFHAQADDGRSSVRAGTVWFHLGELRQVEVAGGLEIETPEIFVRAPGASFEELGGERLKLVLDGPAEVRVEGLAPVEGPLGVSAGGSLSVRAEKRLAVARTAGRTDLEADGDVVAGLGEGGSLRCARLEAGLEQDEGRTDLVRAVAEGGLVVDDPGTSLHLVAQRLELREGAVRIEGAPATVGLAEGRTLQAALLVVGAPVDGVRELRAAGEPAVATWPDPIGAEGTWTIRAPELAALIEEGARIPIGMHAPQGLEAVRTDGLRVAGEDFTWDHATRQAILRGSPARVERGEDLRVDADGFAFEFELAGPDVEPRLESATTIGPASIDVTATLLAEAGLEADPGDFHRFHLQLDGPATLRGGRIEVAAKAGLTAYDAEGTVLLRGEAAGVGIELEEGGPGKGPAGVRRVVGRDAVRLEGGGFVATAKEMVFEPETRRVVVQGDARVDGEGWDRSVSYEAVEFVVTDHGIDLRRAGRVRVRGKAQE